MHNWLEQSWVGIHAELGEAPHHFDGADRIKASVLADVEPAVFNRVADAKASATTGRKYRPSNSGQQLAEFDAAIKAAGRMAVNVHDAHHLVSVI